MAEIETIVEPDSVGDDIWRESVALVGVHPMILAQISDLTCMVNSWGISAVQNSLSMGK